MFGPYKTTLQLLTEFLLHVTLQQIHNHEFIFGHLKENPTPYLTENNLLRYSNEVFLALKAHPSL